MPVVDFEGNWKDNGVTSAFSGIADIVSTIRDDLNAWSTALDGVLDRAVKIKGYFEDSSNLVDKMKSVLEAVGAVSQANQAAMQNNLMTINEMINATKNLGGMGGMGGMGGYGMGGMGGMGGGVGYPQPSQEEGMQSKFGIDADVEMRQRMMDMTGLVGNAAQRSWALKYLTGQEKHGMGMQSGSGPYEDEVDETATPPLPTVTKRIPRKTKKQTKAARKAAARAAAAKAVATTTAADEAVDPLEGLDVDDDDIGASRSGGAGAAEVKAAKVAEKSLLKKLGMVGNIPVFGSIIGALLKNRTGISDEDVTATATESGVDVSYSDKAKRTMRAASFFENSAIGRGLVGAGKAYNYFAAGQDLSKMAGQYVAQSQQLGGATGIVGMQDYGMMASDFVRSGFGLNPFNSYQSQMQNQLLGANLGLRGNALDNYRGLGVNVYQNQFGMNAQQAAQVMGAGLNAGININTMTQGLSSVRSMAQNSQFANTQALTNAYVQGTTGAAFWGANQNAATQVGNLGASFMNNNSILQGQGINGQGGMYSQMGMALMANQLGVSYNNMYTQMSKMSGNQIVGTYDKSILGILRGAGIPVDKVKNLQDLYPYAMQLMAILPGFGIQVSDPTTAINAVFQMIQQSRNIGGGGSSNNSLSKQFSNAASGSSGATGGGGMPTVPTNATNVASNFATNSHAINQGGMSATVGAGSTVNVMVGMDPKFMGKTTAVIQNVVGPTKNGSAPTTATKHRADTVTLF